MHNATWEPSKAPDLSPRDWGWCAGIFEGEGCISTSGGRYALIVRMTDIDVIERFASLVKVGYIFQVKHHNSWKPHYKEAWEWRVNNWSDILMLRDNLVPLLGQRRQAKFRELLKLEPRHPHAIRKTVCKRGHPLSGEGSSVRVVTKHGKLQRNCRMCAIERNHSKLPSVSGH